LNAFPPIKRVAGLPLSLAGGLPPVRSDAAATLRAADLPDPDVRSLSSGQPALARILRPQAAQRWMSPQLSTITPQYVESVLRGGFSGGHIQQWELFDLMEDTWPELAACAAELKNAVLRKPWTVEAYTEEEAEPTKTAQERQKLVAAALRKMKPAADRDESGFDALRYDILDAWLKGTSVQCVDWQTEEGDMHIVRAGQLGDITAPRASFFVHPRHYAWGVDGRLGLRPVGSDGASGVPTWTTSLQASGTEVVPFPKHQFIIAISKAKTGPAISCARLRVLAWWWCAANFSADWLMNLAQVFGLPIRWANYQHNAPQGTVDAVCSMLENMGSNPWAAFPEGTTINLEQPTNIGDNSPQGDLINRADVQARKVILGQTMSGSNAASGAGNGAGAFGKQEGSVKDDNIETAGDFVCRVLSEQLIPSILELNYGEGDTDEAPRLCLVEDEQAGSEQASVVSTLAAAGVEFSVDELRKKFGFRKPRQGEETIGGVKVQPAPGADLKSQGDKSMGEDLEDKEALKAAAASPSTLDPQSATAALAAKLHERLRPFLAVLRAVQKISDPAVQQAALEELLSIEPDVLAALRADPEISKQLTGTLATAFTNALKK
jgi:phage gp29-like protein